MEKIKLLVFLLLFFSPLMTVNALDNVFLLYVSVHKNDAVDLNGFELLEGKANVYPSNPGEYTLKMVSQEEKELLASDLQLSFTAYADKVNEKGEMVSEQVELQEVEKVLRLPYSKEAEKIELYHEGKVIFSLDIPEMLCVPDGKCIDYCQGRNDPDCATETTPAVTSTTAEPIAATTTQAATETTETKITTSPEPTEESTTTTMLKEAEGKTPDVMGLLPYAVMALIIAAAAIAIYKKSTDRDIEKKREEFLRWKEEQEKLKRP